MVSKHPKEYYDQTASGYNELHGKEQERKFKLIKEELETFGLTESSTLLDIGCGTCLSFDFFKCGVHGFEPSIEMIKQHPKNEELMRKRKLFCASAEELAGKFKVKFDFIICVTSAHHFSNHVVVFNALRDISTKKTIFAFSLLKGTNKEKKWIEDNFDVLKVIGPHSKITDTLMIFRRK